MNQSESNQVKHYYEAERLLRFAADLNTKLMEPLDDGRRERLETRLGHLEQQAQAHTALAGITLPLHLAPELEPLSDDDSQPGDA